MNSPHYQKGKQKKIAFVFSCPGKDEMKANCPASGITGENLIILLDKLHELGFINQILLKEDLRITNSWDKVLYEKQDAKTEASLSVDEILSADNLQRIENELKDIENYIFCSGNNAQKAVEKTSLKDKVKIINIPHLGLKSLNKTINKDINGLEFVKGGKDNTKKRVEVIAHEILKQENK